MAQLQSYATDSFPERLRRLKSKKDWSRGWLAQKVEIDAQRISKYARELSTPPLDVRVAIARAPGVSPDYLLTGKRYGADTVKNPLLIEKIEEVDELPSECQQTLISGLDSFVKHYKFEMPASSSGT